MWKCLAVCSILIFSIELADAKFRKCYYGGYNLVGNNYSDQYSLVQINDLAACRDPVLNSKAMQINREYKANAEVIKAQAQKIINDPKCKDGKEIVQQYLDKLKTTEENITSKSVDRFDTLKYMETFKEFDIQSAFAIGGLYNAACSNEDHRTFSLIDFETINQLIAEKVEAPIQQVTKENNDLVDCSNVQAFGTEDLDNFSVSMKKGINQTFLFSFNPFQVPDQVIITNQNQKVLYDSGCIGETNLTPPQKISLDAPQDSSVKIKVIQNCKSPGQKGMSAWSLSLKCPNKGENVCKDELLKLSELIKKEAELLKKILDHYELERQCFIAYGLEIWEDLLKFGFIELDNRPAIFSLCPVMDKECELNFLKQRSFDSDNLPLLRAPAEIPKEPLLSCPNAPGKDATIFETISYSYCKVGLKKLGL